MKPQLLLNHKNDEKVEIQVRPEVVTLATGMVREFDRMACAVCTTGVTDDLCILTQTRDRTFQLKVGFSVETGVSTKLHYDDVYCEKQIGEGSFGVVFNGLFCENIVDVKTEEIGVDEDALVEFVKEVAMLDKFLCNYIVHFPGACFIWEHVMFVTEFAGFGVADGLHPKADIP